MAEIVAALKYPLGSYPLYHTQYDSFNLMKNLMDQDFKYHQAMARVAAEMVRSLADSLLIPFNVSHYVWGLELKRQQLHRNYGQLLSQHVANYTLLEQVIQDFDEDVKNFERSLKNINRKDPMAIRKVNDQLVMLEKAFLHPSGLPLRPEKKHLLFAENSNNAYSGSTFPGLEDLLFEIDQLPEAEQSARWQQVRHHVSLILQVIQAAGYTLRDVVNFVEERY